MFMFLFGRLPSGLPYKAAGACSTFSSDVSCGIMYHAYCVVIGQSLQAFISQSVLNVI